MTRVRIYGEPDMSERDNAIAWAQELFTSDFLILDTETTGLGDNAEICQIAVIDSEGNTVLDTLVRPKLPIPHDAIWVHGITNEMVASAPFWADVLPGLLAVQHDNHIVIYNAAFDCRIMRQSTRLASLNIKHKFSRVSCAMEMYAQYHGDWNQYHRSYRWVKLTTACQQLGIHEQEIKAPAHSALGDCLRTLEVIKAMAGRR